MDAEIFWKKVKMKLAELNKNQEWLCNQTGILLGSLRNKISLGRLPSFEDGIKIVEAFEMSMEEFLIFPEKISKEVLNIPVYEQAFSAGRGQELPDTAEILEYVAIPKSLMRFRDNIYAAYVRGDSMEPTLYDDDIILFDNFGYDGTDGIYAINYKGAGFVKRLQSTGEGVKIISDNSRYEPMFAYGEDDSFKVIGKVRSVMHIL